MSPYERPNHPPAGLIAFSLVIMQSGASLPLNRLVWVVLKHYNLAPGQLATNSFKLMAGVHVLWQNCEFGALTLEEFCYAYKP